MKAAEIKKFLAEVKQPETLRSKLRRLGSWDKVKEEEKKPLKK